MYAFIGIVGTILLLGGMFLFSYRIFQAIPPNYI